MRSTAITRQKQTNEWILRRLLFGTRAEETVLFTQKNKLNITDSRDAFTSFNYAWELFSVFTAWYSIDKEKNATWKLKVRKYVSNKKTLSMQVFSAWIKKNRQQFTTIISEQFLISKQIFNYRNENEDIEQQQQHYKCVKRINMREFSFIQRQNGVNIVWFRFGIHKLRNGFSTYFNKLLINTAVFFFFFFSVGRHRCFSMFISSFAFG